MKYPRGFDKKEDIKQIAIRLPDSLFDEIIAMARMEGKDFNAMVIDLMRCGKLCLDESDALEIRQ